MTASGTLPPKVNNSNNLFLLGLYEVDSGLNPIDDDDEKFGHIMAYADLNSDTFTDIITLSEDARSLNMFYFSPDNLKFYLGNELKTNDCSKIINVAVGRSPSHLRVFVTCETTGGDTKVHFYDRTDKGYDESNHPIKIESNSHPWIADLNGDFLEDVMYTDPSSNKIKIAFQAIANGEEVLIIRDFYEAIPMTKLEPDCITKGLPNARMTSPHSMSMIDLDGDCMSDLFLTVEDASSGKKYYEIWLRRETHTPLDISSEQPVSFKAKGEKGSRFQVADDDEWPINMLTGLNSFCLVTREEIPSGMHNLFTLVDVDRDGMVDMVYLREDKSTMQLYTHYNRL